MLLISSSQNTGILSMWKAIMRAGEMAVWSGVLAALPEVFCLVSRTQVWAAHSGLQH